MIKTRRVIYFIAATMAATIGLLHATLTVAADVDLGKALYAPCVACHGADGAGIAAMNGPALAGQDGAYLERQLHNFKSGVRGNDERDTLGKQMQGMAALLADEAAVANVVAYIGSLPSVTTSDTIEHDQRNGEVQYNASCGACHGPAGKGNSTMNAPRLAGLDEAYLRRQYSNFADGVRGSHEEDRLGRQMQMMATMLSTEKDVTDVIGYLLSQ
ncbi:c-type cytochrome [Congregibacter sp.]|uniref:c-type cytochrome n=1 Tax=Congregibacter sp. TaxID=2744308 RepID=UPI00385F1633